MAVSRKPFYSPLLNNGAIVSDDTPNKALHCAGSRSKIRDAALPVPLPDQTVWGSYVGESGNEQVFADGPEEVCILREFP